MELGLGASLPRAEFRFVCVSVGQARPSRCLRAAPAHASMHAQQALLLFVPHCRPPAPPLPCLPPLAPPLQFHFEQAKNKSLQRLAEGRAKPVDRLAAALFEVEGIAPPQVPPYLPLCDAACAPANVCECVRLCVPVRVRLGAPPCVAAAGLSCGLGDGEGVGAAQRGRRRTRLRGAAVLCSTASLLPLPPPPPPPLPQEEPYLMLCNLTLRQLRELSEDINTFKVCGGGGGGGGEMGPGGGRQTEPRDPRGPTRGLPAVELCLPLCS